MSLQVFEDVAAGQRVARVNLLPPEFSQARRAHALRIGLGAALGLVVVACGAGYAVTAGHVTAAQDDLTAERARTVALQAAQEPYAQVPVVQARLRNLVQVQQDVAANDIPLYAYLDRLSVGAPDGVTTTSVAFSVTGAGAATTGTGDDQATTPLAVAGIGTLTVTGSASTQSAVADWMDHVGGIAGLTEPTLTTTSVDTGTGVVTFTSGATLTDAALTSAQ